MSFASGARLGPFHIAADAKLMAVPDDASARERTMTVGTPVTDRSKK